jgi:hypothetical protein
VIAKYLKPAGQRGPKRGSGLKAHIRTCVNCGTVFVVVGNQKARAKTCSRGCLSACLRKVCPKPCPVFTCQQCGCSFKRTNGSKGMFCSRQHADDYRKSRSIKRLEELEANKPKSKEYRCEVCGCEFLSAHKRRFCSDLCRDNHNQRQEQDRLRRRMLRLESLQATQQRRAKAKQPKTCKGCGVAYTSAKRTTYCSGRCSRKTLKRIEKRLRKARLRVLSCEPVDPMVVFRRDRWTCQLCGCKTPRRYQGMMTARAPELDHIIPLALGGAHSYQNTQCACRTCNGLKGAKPLGQLRLCG